MSPGGGTGDGHGHNPEQGAGGEPGAGLAALVHHPLPVLLIFTGLTVFGIASLLSLPIASLPDVEYPSIQVNASLPGASAEVVASTLAVPLERELAQVQGVRLMTSSSSADNTGISLQFESGRNLDAAAVEVEKAIQNATPNLPQDLPQTPSYWKGGTTTVSVFALAMTSEALPALRLSQLASDVVVRRLQELPGVGRAYLSNEQRPAVRLLVDPVALATRDLTLDELRAAIARATVAGPKGRLTGPRQAVQLATNDQVESLEGVRQIIVAWRNGAPVRVGDLAGVESGPETVDNAGWFNGQPAVVIGVLRRPGANVVRTIDGIKAALPGIRAQLPPSVQLDIDVDGTTNTRAAVHHLAATLGVTILAVVAAIFVFVRSRGPRSSRRWPSRPRSW